MKTFFVLILVFLFFNIAFAQKYKNSILFIQFQFIKGEPQLNEMKIVKGKLKLRKVNSLLNMGLSYEVFSTENKSIYQGSIYDPLEQVYEYPGENYQI